MPIAKLSLVALVLATLTACNLSKSHSPMRSAKITDFGALPDATTLNTKAIQATIDSLASSGGGTVIIPAGTFLSGSIFLKPGVNLHLDKDAILKGTTNIADYPAMRTRVEGHFEKWLPALVNTAGNDHFILDGEGTLDGSGQPFWDAFWSKLAADKNTKNLDVPRPRLVLIQNSNHILIKNIHFKDSGFWNLHIYRCDGVTIDGINVKAGAKSPSTDGTDIDSSQNVTIQNATYFVNDDCIAIKGSKGPLALEDKDSPPDEHIRIRNCTFLAGQGMVTVGSEATIVRDVTVEHCTVNGTNTKMPLVRLKLRPDTPQLYEDIHYNDITLNGTGTLIAIQPWTQYFDLQGHAPPKSTVSNISLTNIKGTFASFGTLHGNPGDTLSNITLENINVTFTDLKAKTDITDVQNLTLKNVVTNSHPFTPPPPSTAPAAPMPLIP